jgi:hypothetical protein
MMNASPLPLHAAECYGYSDDSSNPLSRPLIEDASSLKQSPSSEDTSRHVFKPSSCFYGMIAGFLFQAIAVGASVAVTFRFGEGASSRSFLYLFLKFLSQSDIWLYAIVWVTFTMSLTQCGMRLLMNRFEFKSRRSVFNSGVNYLMGVVLGSFAAWTVINVLLGFPVPFLPMVATVCGDLALCYFMIMCYDWGEESLKEETVKDAEIACC